MFDKGFKGLDNDNIERQDGGECMKLLQYPERYPLKGIIIKPEESYEGYDDKTTISFAVKGLCTEGMTVEVDAVSDKGSFFHPGPNMEKFLSVGEKIEVFISDFPSIGYFSEDCIINDIESNTVSLDFKKSTSRDFWNNHICTSFINSSDNVNYQDLKDAGFKIKGNPKQLTFNSVGAEGFNIVDGGKVIGSIGVKIHDNRFEIFDLWVDSEFNTVDTATEIIRYLIRKAMQSKKRYLDLTSIHKILWTRAGLKDSTIDMYNAVLGKGISFKIWKKFFTQWSTYVLIERLLKPTYGDKLRLDLYETISIQN